jgi:hypothetical protein
MQIKGRAKGSLANASFTTSRHFEVARADPVEPQWEHRDAPVPQGPDPVWVETMVVRYHALGERRPSAIARVLQVPLADVAAAISRLSPLKEGLSTSFPQPEPLI